jgi:hypothetical protein
LKENKAKQEKETLTRCKFCLIWDCKGALEKKHNFVVLLAIENLSEKEIKRCFSLFGTGKRRGRGR